MKAITLKSLLGILVLGSMFNLSCNQNSPAPVTPVAPNTSSATTSTTTPEGLALALVGHWYLDSLVSYTTSTNFSVTYYGFNYVFPAPNGGTAQHEEVALSTQTISAPASSSFSYLRNMTSYFWTRNAPNINDTSSYNSNSNAQWQVISQPSSSFLFLQATPLAGYVRSLSSNKLVVSSSNDTIVKTGSWYHWHRQ